MHNGTLETLVWAKTFSELFNLKINYFYLGLIIKYQLSIGWLFITNYLGWLFITKYLGWLFITKYLSWLFITKHLGWLFNAKYLVWLFITKYLSCLLSL